MNTFTGHTPGPWVTYDDHDSIHRYEILAIGKTIARIYCERGDEATDAANAALIAAAPTLLDQRDALVAALRKIASCENRADGDVVDVARAALAFLEDEQ